jgi:hypothetical protein
MIMSGLFVLEERNPIIMGACIIRLALPGRAILFLPRLVLKLEEGSDFASSEEMKSEC